MSLDQKWKKVYEIRSTYVASKIPGKAIFVGDCFFEIGEFIAEVVVSTAIVTQKLGLLKSC